METQNSAASVAEDIEQQRHPDDRLGLRRNTLDQHESVLFLGWRQRIGNQARTQMTIEATSMTSPRTSSEAGRRLGSIEQLFGLGEEDLSAWPGILAFRQHLEICFEELLQDRFAIIWRVIGRSPPSSPIEGWDWCFAVLNAFKASQTQDDDASIEKVCHQLLQGAEITRHDIQPQEKNHICLAIFAVLCWISATLDPILTEEGASKSHLDAAANGLCLAVENSTQTCTPRDLRRPLSKMFCSFRDCGPGKDERPSGVHHDVYCDSVHINNSEDVLYEPTLNYFSLYTVGRVRLKLVNTLTAHLAFDRSTRTLSIFRYPSFCVANISRKHDVTVLRNITSKLLPSYDKDGLQQEPSALYREILLSYHVLFGQSHRSRHLLVQFFNHQSQHRGIDDDPLLPIICTFTPASLWFWKSKKVSALPSSIFPASVLGLDDQLQESGTYSARDDFPVFGRRLLTLQRYNQRQQPSRMRDLWHDRRNPLQWYTFWAVFWVGGVSILMSVLQLFVGVAQLYFTIH